MRLLEYAALDTSRVRATYAKIKSAIERDDFKSADVRKLANITHGRFYRARLDDANRLLLTFVRRGDQTFAVALEVILNHAYESSRFLRGSKIDEARIPLATTVEVSNDAEFTRYVHPTQHRIHLLDKPLSFDDAQQRLYQAQAPIVVVGSAGSGKTALALERLKRVPGDVLYVTRSSYLAQSAREMYFAYFDDEEQNAAFLSMREFLESIHVPVGREANWNDFLQWFKRNAQGHRGIDAHQAFEEIRGVILADPEGVLTQAAYSGLGVKQSIFLDSQRETLYRIFERYCTWLRDNALYDTGLLTLAYGERVQPTYDFMVIDEVQDLTAAQVALLLKALKRPGEFVLCGDSNQIVHPNFFSWSRLKTLLLHSQVNEPSQAKTLTKNEQGARRDLDISILHSNYRSGIEATRVGNTLLRIKQLRFGSIDRESNYLVDAVGEDAGSVTLLEDTAANQRQLNERTRASARVAVLVLRDEDKAEAHRVFSTPLIFSAQEAKGLEYDTVVLFRFISSEASTYREICAGVTANDVVTEADLVYRRGADKGDKSPEIYKFYVNALYVALTRARLTVIFVESQTSHPLVALLAMRQATEQPRVEQSTREEWQREARRLEQQGKVEQALAIRNTVLHEAKVPWPVLDETRIRELLTRVFVDNQPGERPRDQLREFAVAHRFPELDQFLSRVTENAWNVRDPLTTGATAKHLAEFGKKNFKDILQRCDQYGVEYRTANGQTPLMAAATMGNVALIDALLARGADVAASDMFGRTALHHGLRRAHYDPMYASGPFPEVYARTAPTHVDVMVDGHLVRIDRKKTEFLLFHLLWANFDLSIVRDDYGRGAWGYSAPMIEEVQKHLPAVVLAPPRRVRAYLSSVLARNEVARDYQYNRKLFQRISTGRYQWSPTLQVRVQDGEWQPLLVALNLPFMREVVMPSCLVVADALWKQADKIALPPPIRWHVALEREATERAAFEAQRQRDAAHRAMDEDRQRAAAALRDLQSAARREKAAQKNMRAPPQSPQSESVANRAPLSRPSDDSAQPANDRHLRWGTPEARAFARKQLEEKVARVQAEAAAAKLKAEQADE